MVTAMFAGKFDNTRHPTRLTPKILSYTFGLQPRTPRNQNKKYQDGSLLGCSAVTTQTAFFVLKAVRTLHPTLKK